MSHIEDKFNLGTSWYEPFVADTANTAAGANDSGAKKYKMVLFDKAEWQFSEREKEAIEVRELACVRAHNLWRSWSQKEKYDLWRHSMMTNER